MRPHCCSFISERRFLHPGIAFKMHKYDLSVVNLLLLKTFFSPIIYV